MNRKKEIKLNLTPPFHFFLSLSPFYLETQLGVEVKAESRKKGRRKRRKSEFDL